MKTHVVNLSRNLIAFCTAMLFFATLPAIAQEPGEPVELALPAPLRSLKTVPVTEELIQLLENPYATPQRRRSFLYDSNGNEVALPPLLLQPLNINPLTGEPMTLEYDPAEMESEISFAIPAEGDLAVNPDTGKLQRVNPATGLLEEATLEPPENETEFIKNREAAIKLGKALFWDMQVGSDGVQACASCHFQAGIDSRVRNQLNPNHLRVTSSLQPNPDTTLQVVGPNQPLEPRHFPFHKLADITRPGEPLLNSGNVTTDANDVMSSMGVIFRDFVDIPIPGPDAFTAPNPQNFGVNALLPDIGNAVPDPVGGTNGPFNGLRRVEPRNTPTIFAAAFNFDNFWDGRARHDFNGGSVSGGADPAHHILVDTPAGLEATRELIKFSSIASLATGPPLSDFEMSFRGRFWAKIGKKLLQEGVVPLANQLVHTNDSILGGCSNQRDQTGRPGINESYVELIMEAFEDELWSNTNQHLEWMPDPTDGFDGVKLVVVDGPADPTNTSHFTQMEANMALFFGLAVQAFTQILIPDDTPFDRFLDANPVEFLGVGFVNDINPNTPGVQVVGLSERQLHGFDLFSGQNHSGRNPQFKTARCGQCHVGAELTDHSVTTSHAFILADPFTGHPKVITGFLLEEEAGEKAQDAIEIENISFGYDFETGLSTFGQDINGFPSGHALFDNGIYNIGVRPILEDVSRGGNDLFGFPLSLAALALQNMGVPVGTFSGNPIYTVTPLYEYDQVFNQFTGQWELVLVPNPFTGVPEPVLLPAGVDIEFPPQLPEYYEPFANELPVGEAWPQIDRTTFIPDVISSNIAVNILPDGSFPNPNRVGRMGNFKAPQLRNVELTGPYFHNGGMLTLRQVIDFYARGGDFPASNNEHRDPHILNLNVNFFSQFTEAEKVALVDFLLALTDDRVRYERAPFDHPEVFVPVNGTAPDNPGGRAWLLSDARFQQIPAGGAEGRATPLPNFLNISSTPDPNGPDHFDSHTPFSSPNNPPMAANDAFEVTALTLNALPAPGVLENDNDPDADPITAALVSGPTNANGSLTLNRDGSFTYRYSMQVVDTATDSFTYKINDGNVDGNTAAVTLIVYPRTNNTPPVAMDDTYAATAQVPLNIAAPGVLANDSDPDGDGLTAILVSGPTHPNGGLTLNPDGSFSYTNSGASASVDTFTYKVNDGVADSGIATVTISNRARLLNLAEAVDATQLTWTTGGNAPWLPQILMTHDGEDAARSGAISHSQQSWFETTLTGPVTLSFWVKVSSEPSNDRFSLYVNGSERSAYRLSGEVDWQFKCLDLPAGTFTVRFRFNRNSSGNGGQNSAWVDQITLSPLVALAEAVDGPTGLSWTTGGSLPWVGQTQTSHDGVDAGRSGLITHSQESWAQTTVTGPGTLSFWWKVSSELNDDRLRLYINGSERLRISGEVDWEFRSIVLSNGTYAVRFRYNKDGSVNGGEDRAYVDEVQFTAGGGPPPPPTNAATLVAFNSIWKYLDNGSDQSTRWRNVFDDSTWASGPAQLGYGDGDEATVVSFGADANNKIINTYYRRTFNVADPTAYQSLLLELVRDDGAVVYLNGVEVFRSNMPAGAIGHETLASTAVADADEATIHSTAVSPNALVAGPNVLAVEIHQAAVTSSDTSFDLRLTGVLSSGGPPPGPVAPAITSHPANQSVTEGANVNFSVTASGTAPLSYQWRRNGVNLANSGNISGVNTTTLMLSNVQETDEANYSVVVTNVAGTATSSNATLTVSPPASTPPSIGEALDNPGLDWFTYGGELWIPQTAMTHDGQDAARSGAPLGQDSTLTCHVTGPAVVTFWWKTISEAGTDSYIFYVGGSTVATISGNVDWQQRTFNIPSGTQELKWKMKERGAYGPHYGWLDQVVITR